MLVTEGHTHSLRQYYLLDHFPGLYAADELLSCRRTLIHLFLMEWGYQLLFVVIVKRRFLRTDRVNLVVFSGMRMGNFMVGNT